MYARTNHGQPDFRRLLNGVFGATVDRDLAVTAEPLRRILAYWRGLSPTGRPRRQDLDPVEIGADLPYVALVDIERDPLRFRWRLLGGHIVNSVGRNSTGRTFDSLYCDAVYLDAARCYSRSVLLDIPLRYTGTARLVDKNETILSPQVFKTR
jgi:hypothetical protein